MSDTLIKQAERLVDVFFNLDQSDPLNQMVAQSPSKDGTIRIFTADDCTVCTVEAIEGMPATDMAEAICSAGRCIRDLLEAIKTLRDNMPNVKDQGPGKPAQEKQNER